jgi:hypothetical protein
MRLFLSGLFATAVAASGFHYAVTGVVAYINEATAVQCASQDWPAHQREAHVAFCEMEGHSLGAATRE